MVGQNIGKYRVIERVGRGGMGTVYRAMDETLNREVAIKVLNAELNDPSVGRRFRAEAITVARLNHPGIATVFELFQHDGQWLMVMEFVRGETLEALVTRKGALTVDQAVDLCMQALAALAHAHSLGVVHRDLKPANIMMGASGSVKIMDFGIARVAGTEHLTSAGFMMGTPDYMAPEQVLGHETDARADIYAMGVVLYYLATAKLPFKSKTPFEAAQARLQDAPIPIRSLREDLPPWIAQVMDLALARAPEARFQTAPVFREALRRGLANLPIETPTASAMPPELVATALPGSMRVPIASPPTGASTPLVTNAPPTPPAASPTIMPTVLASGTAAAPAATGTTTPGAGEAPPSAPVTMASATMLADAAASAPTIASPAHGTRQSAAAPPPAAAAAESRQTSSPPAMRPAILAVAAMALAVIAWLWLRPRPASVSEQASVPSPPVVAAPAESATTTTTATPAPPADATSPAPGSVSSPAAPPGAGVGTAAPAGASAATGGAGTPARGSAGPAAAPAVPGAAPAPGATAAARGANARGGRGAVTPDPHVAFSDVRALVVAGKKASEQAAVLHFVDGRVSLLADKTGVGLGSLSYKDLVGASYIKAKNPRWDKTLASPPADVDMPGGLFRSAHHWLVLQSRSSFLIVRLTDEDWEKVLETVSARTGLKVERLASGG